MPTPKHAARRNVFFVWAQHVGFRSLADADPYRAFADCQAPFKTWQQASNNAPREKVEAWMAAACRELVTFRIIPDRCTGCQMCVKVCPTKAITGPRAQVHNLDQSKCIKCRACYEICRFDAVAGDAIILVS